MPIWGVCVCGCVAVLKDEQMGLLYNLGREYGPEGDFTQMVGKCYDTLTRSLTHLLLTPTHPHPPGGQVHLQGLSLHPHRTPTRTPTHPLQPPTPTHNPPPPPLHLTGGLVHPRGLPLQLFSSYHPPPTPPLTYLTYSKKTPHPLFQPTGGQVHLRGVPLQEGRPEGGPLEHQPG